MPEPVNPRITEHFGTLTRVAHVYARSRADRDDLSRAILLAHWRALAGWVDSANDTTEPLELVTLITRACRPWARDRIAGWHPGTRARRHVGARVLCGRSARLHLDLGHRGGREDEDHREVRRGHVERR